MKSLALTVSGVVSTGASAMVMFMLCLAASGHARADQRSPSTHSSDSSDASDSSDYPQPAPDLFAPQKPPHPRPSLHPAVILRDREGHPVVERNTAVDAVQSCSGCHDVEWIIRHSSHGAMSSLEPKEQEPSCLLCHVSAANLEGRRRAFASQQKEWADTALLQDTGLVQADDAGRWSWQKAMFGAKGEAAGDLLGLGPPANTACGACHGLVYSSDEPLGAAAHPLSNLSGSSTGWRHLNITAMTGAIFSDQRIRASAYNLRDKASLDRPWDIHTERLVSCRHCHYSPNHPAHNRRLTSRTPEHLAFEPRRLDLAEYLVRPDHQLVRSPASEPGRQACEHCHHEVEPHAFLPRARRHFEKLTCEACHIDRIYGPSIQEIDWTVPIAPGLPAIRTRGSEADQSNAVYHGYEPILLPARSSLGPTGVGPLLPHNIVTTWRWFERREAAMIPVEQDRLDALLFVNGAYRTEVAAILDADKNGRIDDQERKLANAERASKMTALLEKLLNSSDLVIQGTAAAVPVHHGVGPARTALRTCEACHSASPRSRIAAPFLVSSEGLERGHVLPGEGSFFGPQHLVLLSSTNGNRADVALTVDDQDLQIHVFGHSRNRIVDLGGLVLLILTLVGVTGHGLMRFAVAHRKREEARTEGLDDSKRTSTEGVVP